jgi:hypothetical protein
MGSTYNTRSSMAPGQCASEYEEVKQRWSVIGLVTKNLLCLAPLRFGRHVKSRLHLLSLAPTNPHWARVVGYGPFSLCVIHKERLYPSSEDINRLMMMMMMTCKESLWVKFIIKTYDLFYYK